MSKKLPVLFLILALTALGTNAQDLIFKRSGEVIQAIGLSLTGQSRSYRLAGDLPDIRRYISTSLVDSILYENGRKETFQHAPAENIPEGKVTGTTKSSPRVEIWDAPPPFKRHAIGTDLAAVIFYRNLNVSYEYLLGKGKTGLHASLSVNLNPQKINIYQYDNSTYDEYSGYNLMGSADWNARVGYQVFIFPPGLFQFGGGLYYVTGKFTENHTRYIEQEPWTEITSNKKRSINGLLLAPLIYLQLTPDIRLEGALDIPLAMEPNLNVFLLRGGISFNF